MSSSVLTGLDTMTKRLEMLATRDARRIALKAVGAGMSVAKRSIRPLVPTIQDAVGSRFAKKTSATVVGGLVGIGVGQRATARTRYWPTVVTGTNTRFRTTKNGVRASTGRVVGNDAVSRGASAAQGQITAVMRTVVKNELKKLNSQ